jgi:hypothetical protein
MGAGSVGRNGWPDDPVYAHRMNGTSEPSRRIWVVVVIVIALVLRVALGLLTWEPGWSALTWDDFTRVAIAQEWATEPFIVRDLVWLPLPFWITGTVYALAGRWFEASPMALMAVLNTVAIFVVACVSARTAHKIFKDLVGTVVVFLLVLFAPWGYFLSLSGLAEPLYFVAISVAVAGLASWSISGKDGALAVGSAAVAAAAAMRYEGWWLAIAWVLVVGVDTLVMLAKQPFGEVVRARLRTIVVAAAPLAVPLAWMVTNFVREGSPLYFAHESSRYFRNAYGSFDRPIERILYYPMALFRAAPFLLILAGASAFIGRRRRPVVMIVGLLSTQFVLFYLSSTASGAIGAFPERFLFAYALGLAPIVGGLPRGLSRALSERPLRVLVVVLSVAALIITAGRLQDRPEEWTHAPDLLAVNEHIGAAVQATNILAATGYRMETDLLPINVQNGDRVAVAASASGDGSDSVSLWLERDPGRIVEMDLDADPAIGRFRLSGPLASELDVRQCAGCDNWVWIDESGVRRDMGGGPYLGFEFITHDPEPGQRVAATREITRTSDTQRGSVDLRWLYGHGFNHGRMRVAVTLDGSTVFEADIADPSRWTQVGFEVPRGDGLSELRVEVAAQPGIESGWEWGRASTVLIRELVLESS